MIPISQAIAGGKHADPLLAALDYIHALTASPEQNLRALHRAWPRLGESVRSWPGVATGLEASKLLPECRKYQQVYRREIHMSLWKAITDMHDRAGLSNALIAVSLKAGGL